MNEFDKKNTPTQDEQANTVPKKTILFVDDDKIMLDSLKRMLYSMREEWIILYASSAAAALDILDKYSFDVIVSDMHMPDMDGAELLRLVKEKYPQTIRFILSGYNDRKTIIKTIESADQFISRPCTKNDLVDAINKACEVKKLVSEPQNNNKPTDFKNIVREMTTLPTLPTLYIKLKELLESPTSSFKDIAEIISQDITVSAKVLQLVNSAFFGLKKRIENIQHAVIYLGTETLRAIILTTNVFSQFNSKEIETFGIKQMYLHSIIVSALSRQIAQTIVDDQKFIDEAVVAGMLHDIGKIIFIKNTPSDYEKILTIQQSEKERSYVIEKKQLSVTHAEAGAYLMGIWGLSDVIVNGILYHHSPQGFADVSTVVNIANSIVNSEFHPDHKTDEINSSIISDSGLLKYLRQICRQYKNTEDKFEAFL